MDDIYLNDEVILLDDADRLKAIINRGRAIAKSISDFNFEVVAEKYLKKGGYDKKKSFDENFKTFIKVVGMATAMGKKLD